MTARNTFSPKWLNVGTSSMIADRKIRLGFEYSKLNLKDRIMVTKNVHIAIQDWPDQVQNPVCRFPC